MRVPFGTLPAGARFRIVNRDSGQVLEQREATKVAPGRFGPQVYNAVQPSSKPYGRQQFYVFVQDDDVVEVE